DRLNRKAEFFCPAPSYESPRLWCTYSAGYRGPRKDFSSQARAEEAIFERRAIQINIRDVPERVRDELAARAALQGKSMQEFLRAELERLAARPSIDAWLQQVRKRKRATQTRVSTKQILEHRNADRRCVS